MKKLTLIIASLIAIASCGKSGGSGGGSGGGSSNERVREIAVGGDLAMNQAVQRVKPPRTEYLLLYEKLKEYNNSVNDVIPCDNQGYGYIEIGGNTTDSDYDGVFRNGYYYFSRCIFYTEYEFYIPVYVYFNGRIIGLDPDDRNPYTYKVVFDNFFYLIYIPLNDFALFFADYYAFDTLYVSGNASGVSSNENAYEDIGWGYGEPGGNLTYCEYMGQGIDSLGANYKPDDNQFNPKEEDNANYYPSGYYVYSYENFQTGKNTCNDSKAVDSLGANIDINPGNSGTSLHRDTTCKYDPRGGEQDGTKRFNSGKARLKDRASGAIAEINYGSDCKASYSGAGLYGYVPPFGPKNGIGGIIEVQKFIRYKLETTPAYKLFSNNHVNAQIANKFEKIKQKVSSKHIQMKRKLELLKSMY